MSTYSLPGDNLPTERTPDSLPPVVTGSEADWSNFDEDGNPVNG